MALGKLGRRGGFGSGGAVGGAGASNPTYTPSLDFSDARNSQYTSIVGF